VAVFFYTGHISERQRAAHIRWNTEIIYDNFDFEKSGGVVYPVIDNSKYLKGLLILARRDRRLAQQEKEFIRIKARDLGFSKDFYEDVLKGLMANKYITEEPIVFSERAITESFLHDGLRLAYSDNDFDEQELAWLKQIAYANGIEEHLFEDIVREFTLKRAEAT
jgi:hypothetical protein